MKNIAYLIFIFLVSIGCQNTEVEPIPADIEAELDKEFVLQNKQSANLTGYNFNETSFPVQMKVNLFAGTYSECPSGVVCIVGTHFAAKLSLSNGSDFQEVLLNPANRYDDTLQFNNIHYIIEMKGVGTQVDKKTKLKEFKDGTFILRKL